MKSVFRILATGFSIAILLMATTGCETTDPGLESDIPWNQPQPWEGAPGIPGMSQ